MPSAERGVLWAGWGHYAPDRRVANPEIETELGLPAGWIARRTGIEARRYAAPDQALSDLARPAGAAALAAADTGPGEVGLLLLATSTPDHALPPTAPLVAHQLGLRCGAVDLAGACSGFLYALHLGGAHVRLTGQAVLVIGANLLSRRINPAETASRVLFADAAGAVLLRPSDDPRRGPRAADLGSDGAGYGLISVPAGGSRRPWAPAMDPAETRMAMPDGPAVFAAAVEGMVGSGQRALRSAGLRADEIATWVPHQANARIVRAVGERLGLGRARLIGSLAEFGNSSAATIPLSLSLAHARGAPPVGPVLLSAFGAGTVWASLVWSP
ncbi:MAG: beta-ketoacyl-ACP synthase 3 [Proteobacteria bacterium]|nr:beta-ketoacyl-ACP synthase 3 [Pseudomonadota bacterium]MBS0574432.1 beta-ketoacyl-ACP synthase 3 [Pseudomonadota bacterium]